MPFSLEPFHGIFPAALTMFDAAGRLDEEASAKHWDWLIRQGVDGLVIAGTSGEFIALEREERIRLFRLARKVAGGRVPLVFGSGHYSTKLSIELSEVAASEGASALILILPYYQRPPKPAVIEHYREIRAHVNLPLMLYNNPANTACVDLNPREVARLVEEDVLHMVKSTYESVVPVHDLSLLVEDRMRIFYGSFMAAFEALCAGAHGWISGILNVVPAAARRLYEACVVDGDCHKGLAIWRRILPLVHLYTYQPLGPVNDLAIYRAMLKFWGLQGGYSRRPFQPLTAEQEQALRRVLEETGWIEPETALAGVG
mgnify:CR=1 FL=1